MYLITALVMWGLLFVKWTTVLLGIILSTQMNVSFHCICDHSLFQVMENTPPLCARKVAAFLAQYFPGVFSKRSNTILSPLQPCLLYGLTRFNFISGQEVDHQMI